MRTRLAKYSDVGPICRYLKEQHEATGWDIVPINPAVLRTSVVSMIRTQEVTDVFIAEDKEGTITGVLLASVDRFFWAKKFYASSVHFISTGGGPSLLRAFKDWAQRRKCACIIEAVATDDPRAELFLEAGGFERRGGALVCWLDIAEKDQAA